MSQSQQMIAQHAGAAGLELPAAVAEQAAHLLEQVLGQPDKLGDSSLTEGWWLETHTLGCRNAADTAEGLWWDEHWEIYDEYAADGKTLLVGDPAEGLFLSLTPPL